MSNGTNTAGPILNQLYGLQWRAYNTIAMLTNLRYAKYVKKTKYVWKETYKRHKYTLKETYKGDVYI